jgi:preprotein translocase subunit SecB
VDKIQEVSMIASLQLDDFVLEELVIRANPFPITDGDNDQKYTLSSDFDLDKREGAPVLGLRLAINVDGDTSSAAHVFSNVRIVLIGFFSFAEGSPEEYIRAVTPGNQLSILYGIARGIVATATGTAAGGKINLPPVNINDMIQAKLARIQKDEKPAKPVRKRAAVKVV